MAEKKEDLGNMAKRYKEEMLRLYRMNGAPRASGNVTAAPAPPSAVSVPAGAVRESRELSAEKTAEECAAGDCRFPSPEEIISGASSAANGNTASSSGDTDITASLIDGTGFVPDNLASSGSTDCDCDSPDTHSPQTGTQAFRLSGVLIRTIYTSAASVSENPLPSDVYAEEIPSFLRLPPDVAASDPVPPALDISYAVTDRWNSLTGDGSWGYIQFDITHGEDDSPLEGATAVISRRSGDRTVLSRILSAGSEGLTSSAALPSPAAGADSGCTPYAVYNAMIFAGGHYPVYNMKVKIYPGIKTVQPVRLAALPAASE